MWGVTQTRLQLLHPLREIVLELARRRAPLGVGRRLLRVRHLLGILLRHRRHVLQSGEEGAG